MTHATSYTELLDLTGVESLDDLLRRMDGEAYEASDGVYSDMPTWGPETPEVTRRILASCDDMDIVSWDTRAEPHRYLMRRRDCERHVFRIEENE